ncbi:unnamed protein product [Rotaria socialis]|uniref:Uncharacterized protein n=1 Tax=Rotaria socialis TaxID=392032 RepID=A0A821SF96_9BILA|nr:unnamed protein product [Rotaria socialis]
MRHMLFPGVTVCSANPYREDRVKEAIDVYARSHSSDANEIDRETLFVSMLIDLFNRNESDELVHLGFQKSDMLLECSYNGISCSSNFIHSLSLVFGNCFTFNWKDSSHKLYSLTELGSTLMPYKGLSMTFYVPSHLNYPLNDFEDGLILFLHDNNEIPFIAKNTIATGVYSRIHALKARQDLAVNETLMAVWCSRCVPQCVHTHFSIDVSALSAPNVKQKEYWSKRLLRNDLNISLPNDFAVNHNKYIDSNYLRVTVTCGSAYVTVHKQAAKITLIHAFSAVGGQTGFALSVMELFELIYRLILKEISLWRYRRNIQVEQPAKLPTAVIENVSNDIRVILDYEMRCEALWPNFRKHGE